MKAAITAFVALVLPSSPPGSPRAELESYSSGERAGWVQKFSNKGWVCKDPGERAGPWLLPGSTVEKFMFTVHDDALAQQISAAMGKRVSLHYEEKVACPPAASAIRATPSPRSSRRRTSRSARAWCCPRTRTRRPRPRPLPRSEEHPMRHDLLAFVGGGNMARPSSAGWSRPAGPGGSILVVDPGEAQRARLAAEHGVRTQAAADAAGAGRGGGVGRQAAAFPGRRRAPAPPTCAARCSSA